MVLVLGFVVPDIVAVVAGILWLAATVLGIIFSIAMLFDCLKRSFKNQAKKIIWIFVVLFVPFGSLVYYFLYKRKK